MPNITQQEQIQHIDTKIQEILATRKKYNSLENLHKKANGLSCLDETKASSSNSSQTRGGNIYSNKAAIRPNGIEFQPPRSSDKNFIKDQKDFTFKPRVIRTTTPYKQSNQGFDFNKLLEKGGKINFDDINQFKRIEAPDEHIIMNGTMKPLSSIETSNKKEGTVHLPPLNSQNQEKLTFTGTFNPHSFEKNNHFMKHAAPKKDKNTNNNNVNNKEEYVVNQTSYFVLEDAMKAKNIFLIKTKEKSGEGNEDMSGSKQKKFPKEVFATNVKRKFFV